MRLFLIKLEKDRLSNKKRLTKFGDYLKYTRYTLLARSFFTLLGKSILAFHFLIESFLNYWLRKKGRFLLLFLLEEKLELGT